VTSASRSGLFQEIRSIDVPMTLFANHRSIRIVSLPVISASVVLLAAVAFDPESNWARLRSLPNDRRAKLVENINSFDLKYGPQQQQSLRDLDRRINELSPESRAQYLEVLNRYHNWLNQLPENKQYALSDLAPADRMAAVRKLIGDYPLSKPATARFLRRVDVGEYSPLELASLFMIWQALSPAQRRDIERLTAIPKRHEAISKLAEAQSIPHEITIPNFDEASAAKRFEEFARANRPVLLPSELRKKKEGLQTEPARDILRRQAINYYFSEHQPKSVTSERLSQFLAAFPPWLQSAFDPHPPEEAQRRLTVVYRLVFPHPAEIKPSQKASPGAPAQPPGPGRAPGAPPSSKRSNPI
jgi:hypothetical protein